jgi:hypothetical protein
LWGRVHRGAAINLIWEIREGCPEMVLFEGWVGFYHKDERWRAVLAGGAAVMVQA